jgi:hypothetical protein
MPPSTTSARTWQLTAAIAASVTVLAAAAYFLFRAGPEEEEEESAPPAASQRSGGGAGSAAAAAAGPASGSGASSSSGGGGGGGSSSASSGSSVSSAKGAAAVGASGMTRERLLEYLRDLIRAYTKLDVRVGGAVGGCAGSGGCAAPGTLPLFPSPLLSPRSTPPSFSRRRRKTAWRARSSRARWARRGLAM